jgi:hypothetical protein
MSNSGPSAVQFTPSDTVLLAYDRFAAPAKKPQKMLGIAALPDTKTVNPFESEATVLAEPLAKALVSSALLANESAGVVQLAMDGDVLQAVPTEAGTLWPANSLEDRLRRNRKLPVAEMVEDWLEASSPVPYRRAVRLAEQGMATRGLAEVSKAGDEVGCVLTDATREAATAIDGAAARLLLEACQKERPQVWTALQKALTEAFQKRGTNSRFGYSWNVNYSTEVAVSRDAPLGFKLENAKTTRSAPDKDFEPVQLLEASPAAVASGSDRPDEYSTQRAVAAKLPGWVTWLINRFKKFLSPTSAEVGAAIKARVEAQKSAAPERHETVDTSATVAMGQSANIRMHVVEAKQLSAPTEEQRKLLDRTGRDWARLQHEGRETPWQRWRRRRARARLLKSMPKPYRLLMLRVFGSPAYDDLIELIKPWRRVGVIQHLEGFDTIGTRPEAIAAGKSGRIEDILVETKERVERELSALSLAPDDELLFERQAFQCTDTTWQLAVRGMLDGADAVVMDLSSLSPTNQGCAWELGQLLDRVPLSRVTLLVNDSTDLVCLQTSLDAAARRISAKSPNREDLQASWQVVRIGGLSQRQPNESYFDWKRRIDTRLEPEVLTSFLMTNAEPRRNSQPSCYTRHLQGAPGSPLFWANLGTTQRAALRPIRSLPAPEGRHIKAQPAAAGWEAD